MTVAQWSTTAGLNTLSSGTAGTGGVNIDEGMAPSGVNNAMRDIMAQWATFITDANFTLTSADAGASANPTLTLYRNSATPAASDLIGNIIFAGEDSAGNTETYADILASINDATSTSEDGALSFRNKVAGTMRATFALGAGTATLSDFDAGAAIGPTLSLYRSSASPAASDIIGGASFVGKDSGGNDTTYASLFGRILDTTDTSEDGEVALQLAVAGSLAEIAKFSTNGPTFTSADAGATFGPILTLDRNSGSPAANDVIGGFNLNGRDSGGNSATYATVYGTIDDPTNGSEDGVLSVQVMLAGTATDAAHFRGGVTRFYQNTTSTPGAGNNTVGHAFDNAGGAYHSSASAALNVNRTADGNLVGLYTAGNVQAVISIAAGVATYGTFFGSHWSQLADGSKPDILRGTIVESLDQMCKWPGEERNDTLPRFKISDTPASPSVYGVFAWWEIPDGPSVTNDAFIGALGTFVVRMSPGAKVRRGDLIESAGNGCGRVQNNDAMRSSTVAKVTSTEVVDRYPDGSYTVPCTLHCG